MSSSTISSTPTLVYSSDDGNGDFLLLIKKWGGVVLRYWYWFLASMVAALIVGYLYVERQDRVYHGQTTLLIENAEDSEMGLPRRKNAVNVMAQLNGIDAGEILENELFMLSSLRLMKKVVHNLHLEVDYTVPQGLHTATLYRNRPFEVRFAQPTRVYTSMVVMMDKEGGFELSEFVKAQSTEQLPTTPLRVKANEWITTPIGRLMIVPTALAADFDRATPVTVQHFSNEMAGRIYQQGVSADPLSKQSTLINLGFSDANRERAEDVLYEIVNVYKNDIVENKNRVAQGTAEFIDERIRIIAKELSEVEGRLAGYKQSNQIVDVESAASSLTQQNVTAQQRALELHTQYAVAQSLTDYLRTTAGAKEVIPVVGNFGNSGVAQQITEYNRLLLERQRTVENMSESSPAVRDLDRQLDGLRNAINGALNSHVKAISLELRAAQAHESRVQGWASSVPKKERQMVDITRQQTLKEALYTFLLNKREEVALQLAIEEANIRIVEEPMVGDYPVAPRRSQFLLIALAIGLLIPAFVFWLKDVLDTTISSRREVEEATDIPIAGDLPHVEDTTDATLVYSSPDEAYAPAAEAFRVLRHGLHFMNREAKVYLVTSSTPGQGKSFVSRNLSNAFALTGKRVLLVDVDVRMRNLSKNFESDRHAGLTEYLVGDRDEVESIILRDKLAKGFDFLPAGPMPPNASELLMSERFDQLIARLRTQYDYILLDTTPCFAVADASIVARLADVTLMVVRVGVQLKANLDAIDELYDSHKLGNLCIVINDSDVKARTYGYGYTYQKKKKRRWLLRRG